MDVRDAVEADADAIAALADTPGDVVRNLVHDRSVRVAEAADAADGPDAADAGPDADGADRAASLLGFVSFDARPDAVHVTQIDGTPAACTRLLDEPIAFARREGMPVEVVVPADGGALREAVEDVGFEEAGSGPRFDGEPTVRYRLEP